MSMGCNSGRVSPGEQASSPTVQVQSTPSGSGPTYYQDAKPILDAKCGPCHVPGGAGGFDLTTFAAAHAQLGAMQPDIAQGLMPPWPPDDSCNSYHNDRGISTDEKKTLLDWIAAGGLQGDPNAPPPPAVQVEAGGLPRIDATLMMNEFYVPVKVPNEYRCFVIDWPYTTTKYVTGFVAKPGNKAIVHHAIAFLAKPGDVATVLQKDANDAGPGYDCFGAFGANGLPHWLGAWAPGDAGEVFGSGSVDTGIRVDPNSKIVLQVHYHAHDANSTPDLSGVQLMLADSVAKEGYVQPWLDPLWLANPNTMTIAAGAADAMHNFALSPYLAATIFNGVPTSGLSVYGVGLHMHTLGSHATLSLEKSGGNACLLQINRWDFNWQGMYMLKKPQPIGLLDKLYIECHWDNTAAHQTVVGTQQLPPRTVTWGENTEDEMCLGIVYLAPSP